MILRVRGGARITGTVRLPGDKSISHRALMFGAVAEGISRVSHVAPGADVASTASCLEAFGVQIQRSSDDVVVSSPGIAGWQEAADSLDCGNSGTTMRLMAGLAARHAFATTFDGDASLRSRPMERVARPLRALGATIDVGSAGGAPITVRGGALVGTDVDIGVASAQVKSAVVLAGLGADGRTVVTEPLPSRDHTERMLGALGLPVSVADRTVTVEQGTIPSFDLDVPGDVSSAAFVVAAGVLCGRVEVGGVGLNPGRIGFLRALERMGAAVSWEPEEERLGEPCGTVRGAGGDLRGFEVDPATVPSFHDELPLLAVVATQAEGETVVTGAEELRVKESDRVMATTKELRALGAQIEERSDGFVVRGPTPLRGTDVSAHGDHRIAMALAVAGLVADGETRIDGFECAAVSWPGMEAVLAELGAEVAS